MNRSTIITRSLILISLAGMLAIAAAPSVAAPATAPVSGDEVVRYLDGTIDWYRRVQSLTQSSNDSQELLLRSTLSQNSRQVVQLGLRFARAESAISNSLNDANNSGATARGRSVAQAAASAAERAAQFRARLDDLESQIQKAPPESLDLLYGKRYELTAELNLANTQRDVMQEYAVFMIAAENGDGAALSQKIDELERSVPNVQSNSENKTPASPAAAPQAAQQFQPESAGIFALISEMLRLSNRMGEVGRLADQAAELRATNDRIRQPMREDVLSTMRTSNATTATSRPAPDDRAALESRGMHIDALTDRFKQLSSVAIPLAEQNVMLDAARQGLTDWRAALGRQHSNALRTLLLRLGSVVGTLIVVFFLSELWRRATFRYIHDARRQRQLMLVRRLVVGLIVLIIVVVSVVSEFGSIATFAGLITAGVAVALQTVILSGVAYFFFIGRFGVRVGDRVTITNITGDVIEIGLFRIYLMELGGVKPDLRPTGRIVVFSNSVLFQPSAFYKQLPGADYVWHEVSMTVAPNADFSVTEQRLLGAVNLVFGDYRQSVEQQHELINKSLHVDVGKPVPEGRLRFVDAGLEFVVRYPVELDRAAQTDDRITRELLKAIQQEPKLDLVSGTPRIRPG